MTFHPSVGATIAFGPCLLVYAIFGREAGLSFAAGTIWGTLALAVFIVVRLRRPKKPS